MTLFRERPTVVMVLKGRAPAKFSRGGVDTNVPSAAAASLCNSSLENAMTLRYSKRDKNGELVLIVPFTMTLLNQDT